MVRRPFAPVRTERLLRVLLQRAVQAGVRVRGRPVDAATAWATGPTGEERIGPGIYERYAAAEGLRIASDPDGGLLADLAVLDGPHFSAGRLDPSIRDFYEHTARWSMDVDVHWRGPLRFFAQTLLYLVSREIEQLNVPLSQGAVSGGISSEILPLVAADGTRPYTGWLRRFRQDEAVIYAGFYTNVSVPGLASPHVKVAFPMPKGCTTVVLRPENVDGAGLRLVSSGRRFGDPGAYRLHGAGRRARVAYVPVHERFDLWAEQDGAVVACDHRFALWRFEFLLLRYRMQRAPT
jgi:hypothetical protein